MKHAHSRTFMSTVWNL